MDFADNEIEYEANAKMDLEYEATFSERMQEANLSQRANLRAYKLADCQKFAE